MTARAVLPLLAALLATACTAAAERGYYTPLGAARAPRLLSQRVADEDSSFEVACQGLYTNRVGGLHVRTMHFQLAATASRPEGLLLPLADLRIDLLWEEPARSVPLGLAEAWQGRERLQGALTVPGWSRRSVDLFFDHPDPALAPPDQVRLRWRYTAGGEPRRGDLTFVRLPPGDPALPPADVPLDRAFGLLDGFYMPGIRDLGPRRLQPSEENRAHYVFHAPDDWF